MDVWQQLIKVRAENTAFSSKNCRIYTFSSSEFYYLSTSVQREYSAQRYHSVFSNSSRCCNNNDYHNPLRVVRMPYHPMGLKQLQIHRRLLFYNNTHLQISKSTAICRY
jgi:hypothetical protein